MSQENVEVVRQGYEAWNRGDLEWLLERTAPDYEFHTAQLFPDTEAVYRGREGLKRFWNTFRAPWKTVRIEARRIEPIDEHRVLALFVFRGRARDGMEVTQEYANLITVEDGLATRAVGYADWQEGLEAAGLSE